MPKFKAADDLLQNARKNELDKEAAADDLVKHLAIAKKLNLRLTSERDTAMNGVISLNKLLNDKAAKMEI